MGISDSWRIGLVTSRTVTLIQGIELPSLGGVLPQKWVSGKCKSGCLVLLEEKFKKYVVQAQKTEVFFIAFLIYNSKAWTEKKKKTYGGCFMEVSQPRDTASHITVSASRIIEKLEIA